MAVHSDGVLKDLGRERHFRFVGFMKRCVEMLYDIVYNLLGYQSTSPSELVHLRLSAPDYLAQGTFEHGDLEATCGVTVGNRSFALSYLPSPLPPTKYHRKDMLLIEYPEDSVWRNPD